MAVLSKEHHELMFDFEKTMKQYSLCPRMFDRENATDWGKGRIYQNGEVNKMFIVFRLGHAAGIYANR